MSVLPAFKTSALQQKKNRNAIFKKLNKTIM